MPWEFNQTISTMLVMQFICISDMNKMDWHQDYACMHAVRLIRGAGIETNPRSVELGK